MPKETIIRVHQLGTIPHYFPLYYALRGLAHNGISVELHQAESGQQMFNNAHSLSSADRGLDCVLAAEHETFFTERDVRTIVDGFVCGSVLIQQAPLWLYARRDFAGNLYYSQTGATKKPRILLPPKDSTATLAFRNEFGQDDVEPGEQLNHLDCILLEDSSFVQLLDAYTEDELLQVANALDKNCDVIVSLHPIAVSGKSLRRLNTSLPRQFRAFTALWIPKRAVRESELLLLFRTLCAQIHGVITTLHKREPGITQEFTHAERVKLTSKAIDQWLATKPNPFVMKDAIQALIPKGGGDALLRQVNFQVWPEIVAELVTHRIWDFNFSFGEAQFATTENADDEQLRIFSEHSLSAYMQEIQWERYMSPLKADVESVVRQLKNLDELKRSLDSLRQRVEGDEDDVKPDRSLILLADRLRMLFIGDYHDAADCIKDRTKFHHHLIEHQQDCSVASEAAKVCAAHISSKSVYAETGLNNIAKYLNDTSARGDMNVDAERIIVYDLKVLSRGCIPMLWIHQPQSVDDPVDIYRHGLDLYKLKERNAGYVSVSGLMRLLSVPIGKWDCSIYYNVEGAGAWSLEATLLATDEGSLDDVAGFVYTGADAPLGQSTRFVALLKQWGLHIRIKSHEDKMLKLECRLPHRRVK